MLYGVINTASSGDTTIIPAIAGMRIRVVGYTALAAGTVVVTWKSASTALSGPMTIGGSVGLSMAQNQSTDQSEFGIIQTAPGEALVLGLSAAVQVGGHLNYKYVMV